MPKAAAKTKVSADEEAAGAPKSRRETVRKLLSEIERNFNVKDTKVTLADFIRLTQLERELEEEEQPREIIVTWSEPPEGKDVER
jgi:hypothetical protein